MKKLLITLALLIALAVPAQASWWSSTSEAFVYGQVGVSLGCNPAPPSNTLWNVVVMDGIGGNVLTNTITNQFGYYTTPLFSTGYIEEAYIYAVHGKSGFGEVYPVEMLPGQGNLANITITACW